MLEELDGAVTVTPIAGSGYTVVPPPSDTDTVQVGVDEDNDVVIELSDTSRTGGYQVVGAPLLRPVSVLGRATFSIPLDSEGASGVHLS